MSKPVRNSSGKNSKIFISYRRTDIAYAGRLCADLKRHFGDDQVFMDVEGIQGGEDFVRVLEARLASAKVLLAVIGPRWLRTLDERRHAQNKTDDWVHLEIATAFERRIKVIPVLVGGAAMPSSENLPDELNALPRQHAITIRDDRWHLDAALLIRNLEEQGGIQKRNRVSLALLAAVALALIGVLLLSWYFFTRQMVANPAADGKFSIPAAILGIHEVTIEGAKLESPSADLGTHEVTIDGVKLENAELLLLHQASPNEEVQVEIEQARISQETVAEYKIDPRSSQTFNYVNYAPAAPEQAGVSKRSCNTLLEVSLKDKTQPVAIHFYQEINTEGGARDLKMKIPGAELVVSMETTAESEDEALGEGLDDGPGCWKHLLVRSLVNDTRSGLYTVTGVVAADSEIQFGFEPLKTPLWEGREGPFAFGSLKAQGVTIRSSKGETIYNLRAVDEASLLRIDSLAVDSKQLRLSVSGDKAFVTIHGEDGVGFRERIHRFWGRITLVGIVTIVLGVWLTVLLRGLFRS